MMTPHDERVAECPRPRRIPNDGASQPSHKLNAIATDARATIVSDLQVKR
jgi:hypothetical protein